MCACIQITALEWDNGYGPVVMSACAIFYMTVCVLYLPFQFLFCYINFDKLSDRNMKIKFGSLWTGQRTDDKGFMYYNLVFYGRRLMIGLIVVFARHSLFYQI